MHNSRSLFDRQGKTIYQDKDLAINGGNIFRTRTVKGAYNHIMALRNYDGFMYYVHGETIKKVPTFTFVRLVKQGELEPVSIHEFDADRLASWAIVLDGLANRRSASQQIDYLEERAFDRARRGEGNIPGIIG